MPVCCHSSLIADALLVRGIKVEDIMSLGSCQIYRLTSFAKVRGRRITVARHAFRRGFYPPAETAQRSKHRQENTIPRKQPIV
jgi:NAD-dependent oxidoreductase involved in siderophore biosynthesis